MAASDQIILAIDDDRDNLTALQAVLGDRLPQSTILLATDGMQGLDLAFACNPDVILLDIEMPDMDGYAVCKKIKDDERLQAIPIIFLTALRTDRESRVKALEAGGEGFLAKPFDEVELLAQIQAMVKIKKANIRKTLEKNQLTALVAKRTHELQKELADRKRVEEALRESNERFLSLADNIPGHVAYVNAHTLRYEFVNISYEKSFGIPREKIIGSHVRDMIGDVHYQYALQFIETAKQGRSVSYENTFDLVGGRRWMQFNLTPVFDAGGDVMSLVVLGFDITKRKAAEQALSESEARYRRITEGLADYQYTVRIENGHAVETKHSPACRVVTGYSAGEFAADPYLWLRMIALEDREMVTERIEQVLAGRDTEPLEHRIIRKDGEMRWVSDNIVLCRNEEGALISYDGVVKDITERKQAEAEKLKLQTQLSQAQKMEAIGVLAGGIAHDFNNILGAILGYTEMARDDAPPGSQLAGDLDQVLAAASRAKDLVKQILGFSRQTALDRIPLKIQPLIKESLKMLRASIPSTIAIKEDIHPQCGAILADPTQVHQITMNLCSNAYHAMEEKGGVLTVEVKERSVNDSGAPDSCQIRPGEYVELIVRDTGAGIGPDIIDKIFDPYYTTKETGKGTGMGLSIALGIVKSYGGNIIVESVPGQGAAFHVFFPVIDEPASETDETQEVPKGWEHVLFVDDEELLAGMGKTLLERLGYTVTAHTRSREALAEFASNPGNFNLVITDQTMPDMTGIELARRMLQIKPGLPIILCTGFSNLVNEESAKAIGIRAFALKPLTKSMIGKLVREVLDAGLPDVFDC